MHANKLDIFIAIGNFFIVGSLSVAELVARRRSVTLEVSAASNKRASRSPGGMNLAALEKGMGNAQGSMVNIDTKADEAGRELQKTAMGNPAATLVALGSGDGDGERVVNKPGIPALSRSLNNF